MGMKINTIKLLALVIFSCFYSIINLVVADESLTVKEPEMERVYQLLKSADWSGAEISLNQLRDKYPDNQVLNNLLSVVFFNQGRTEIAQELLIDVIESNPQSKLAYYNLKKIFSYSAAKTYSEGLQLLTPVKRPRMDLDTTVIAIVRKPVSTITPVVVAGTGTVTKPINSDVNKTKDIEALKVKISEKTSLWKKAWEQGDYKSYVSLYSNKFSGRHANREQWLSDRKIKVTQAKKIKLTLDNVSTKVKEGIVIVRFKQHYRSRNYQDTALKQLVWRQEQGSWLISQERTLKAL